MPLGTQIIRKGKLLAVRWGEFHVAAMTYAAAIDSKEGELYEAMLAHNEVPEPGEGMELPPKVVFGTVMYHVIAATPLNGGSYTLKGEYAFRDPTDGEEFVLLPGDVLHVWR